MDKSSTYEDSIFEQENVNIENVVKTKMSEVIKYFDKEHNLDNDPKHLAIEKLEKLPDYKSKIEVAPDLKLCLDLYINDKTTIIFIGDTCSGKTTMLNSLLASILSKNDNDDWNKYRILADSDMENTFMMTFVESSYDNKFHVELYRDRVVKEKYDFNNDENGIDLLKELLFKYDDMAIEAISKRKKNQVFSQNRESIVRSSIISSKELPLLKVYIPSKSLKFRFIDSPGLSNDEFIEYFLSYTDIFISCIFILVKGLDDPQAINTNLLKPLNILSSKFTNSLFYIIFTKYDKLYNDLKGTDFNHETTRKMTDRVRNASQKQRSLQTFIQTMSHNLQNLKFKDIFLLCPLLALGNEKDNYDYKKEIIRFSKEITNINNCHFHKQKLAKFKLLVFSILNKYNTMNEKDFIFTKEELLIIEEGVEKSKGDFINNLDLEFFSKFPQKLESFIIKYPIWYKEIIDKINVIDNQILNDKYYDPTTYSKDLIAQLECIVESLIKKDIDLIISNEIKKFISNLKDSIKNKLLAVTSSFTSNKKFIEKTKDFTLVERVFVSLTTLTGLGTLAISSLARFGVQFAVSASGIGNAALACLGLSSVPCIGWILGGSLFLGSAIYLIYKRQKKPIIKQEYHNKCIEFIVENIYDQKEKIRNEIIIKYFELLDNLVEIARNQKKISDEMNEVLEIIKSIESPDIVINVDLLSNIFKESIKKQKIIPKGLLKFFQEITIIDY